MTITSKRESIIEHIRTVMLPLIAGTGDYNLSLSTITRRFRRPESYGNYPAVCIVDDIAVKYLRIASDSTYTVGADMSDVHQGMYINLIGYVKLSTNDSGDTGKMSTELNKMHSDLIIAMHNDITLGGNCDSTTLIGSKSELQWVEQGYGIIIHTYAIKYDFNPTASIT